MGHDRLTFGERIAPDSLRVGRPSLGLGVALLGGLPKLSRDFLVLFLELGPTSYLDSDSFFRTGIRLVAAVTSSL